MTLFDIDNPFDDYELFCRLLDERKAEVINQLSSCTALQAKTDRLTFIFHPSTKYPGYFQITYFDEKGPLSDSQYSSIEQVVKDLIHVKYEVLETVA